MTPIEIPMTWILSAIVLSPVVIIPALYPQTTTKLIKQLITQLKHVVKYRWRQFVVVTSLEVAFVALITVMNMNFEHNIQLHIDDPCCLVIIIPAILAIIANGVLLFDGPRRNEI